jgi:hypothetical protein
MQRPVRRGGKLSAYAAVNSPENNISRNATVTSLKGGKARLISALPASSHIENTIKKEIRRQKKRPDLIPTLAEKSPLTLGLWETL